MVEIVSEIPIRKKKNPNGWFRTLDIHSKAIWCHTEVYSFGFKLKQIHAYILLWGWWVNFRLRSGRKGFTASCHLEVMPASGIVALSITADCLTVVPLFVSAVLCLCEWWRKNMKRENRGQSRKEVLCGGDGEGCPDDSWALVDLCHHACSCSSLDNSSPSWGESLFSSFAGESLTHGVQVWFMH